jgi:uncharacterized membrane protein
MWINAPHGIAVMIWMAGMLWLSQLFFCCRQTLLTAPKLT